MGGDKTTKTLRTSLFTFLQNYHHFTSTPTLLALPFAASILLSQSLLSSSNLFRSLYERLFSVFVSAGFPPSSWLTTILNLKLSETIFISLFASPFNLSFLLLAKASVISLIHHKPHENATFSQSFIPLLVTQLCNILVIISANATSFCLLAILFNFFDLLALSSPHLPHLLSIAGAVIYSIVIANAYVVSNLALVLSGTEKRGGFVSILKVSFLIRSRKVTALSLSVLINLALAAVESLFQYRIVRAHYHQNVSLNAPLVMEAMLIAYMYGLVLVVDTIVGYMFLKNCKTEYRVEGDDMYFQLMDIEDRC